MYRLDGELDDVLAFQQLVGNRDGACFGTRDPSRLRPPLRSLSEKPGADQSPSKEGVRIKIKKDEHGSIIEGEE